MSRTRTYALIGDGRLATSLRPYLQANGASVSQWSRQIAANSARSLKEAVAFADVILLAISDRAIADFAAEHAEILSGKPVVHFSGALSFSGLVGCHPLCSFPRSPLDQAVLSRIAFVEEEGAAYSFGELFPALPNKSFAITPAQKPLYHALAVLSGNLVAHAWNRTAKTAWEELGLPPRDVLRPYFDSLLEGFEVSPFDSLTGPVARGDQPTIDDNLTSLQGDEGLTILYNALIAAVAAKGSSDDG